MEIIQEIRNKRGLKLPSYVHNMSFLTILAALSGV
jgi:hypothetical protein